MEGEIKKSDPRSTLAGLEEAKADALYDALKSRPYRDVRDWAEKEWGLSLSLSALARWWKSESRRRARADLREAVRLADSFDRKLDAADVDAKAANALRAKFWDAVSRGDREGVKEMGQLLLEFKLDSREAEGLRLKAAAQKTKDEALALARQKWEAAERRLSETKGVLADSKLSPAEREARLKEIFGL